MLTGLLCLVAVTQTPEGVLFQCHTNGVRVVYLAGDFNQWARNHAGRITDPAFAMSQKNGVWRKTVRLEPGTYRFKFNINGEPDGWFAPDSIDERDADGNAIFRVKPGGAVVVRSARNPAWRPRQTGRGVLFQLYAPEAHIVYLAGDFNNWAGHRAGLVFNPSFAMEGPDSNGVWRLEIPLRPGRARYRFVIDGDRWIADPNAEQNDDEGHSVLVVK
jgi:1,4-alpha-glucan branching enzyme